MKRPLLILRPEPGASATLARARAMGMSARALPLFEVTPREWSASGKFDAVMMTSANAARLGGPQLQAFTGLLLFAIGAATAVAAREAGFRFIITGDGDVESLVRVIAKSNAKCVLHLAGDDRRAVETPFKRTIAAVYAAEARDVTIPETDAIALLHSPRAAARFATLCRHRDRTDLIAISAATAEAAGPGWRSVHITAKPSDDAMLALAATLCDCPETTTGGTE